MKKPSSVNITNMFNIDEAAGIPKYRQLINSVRIAIELGHSGEAIKLQKRSSVTSCMGPSIICLLATQWLNLNNRE